MRHCNSHMVFVLLSHEAVTKFKNTQCLTESQISNIKNRNNLKLNNLSVNFDVH